MHGSPTSVRAQKPPMANLNSSAGPQLPLDAPPLSALSRDNDCLPDAAKAASEGVQYHQCDQADHLRRKVHISGAVPQRAHFVLFLSYCLNLTPLLMPSRLPTALAHTPTAAGET